MAEQGGFGFELGGYSEDRLREFEVDCTPGPIVRQGFETFVEAFSPPAGLRVLDLCAGSGVFGQQARSVLDRPHLTAVEIRPEERPNLERWYDVVRIADVRTVELGEFDLVVGNPAFTLWVPVLERAVGALAPLGVAMLLGLNELGTRGSVSRGAWERWVPAWQWRIAGTIGFRGPGLNPKTGKPWGCDQRSYSWWSWRRPQGWAMPRAAVQMGRLAAAWSTMDLALLSAAERSWVQRPGTEEG
jgi:hypothetical protein